MRRSISDGSFPPFFHVFFVSIAPKTKKPITIKVMYKSRYRKEPPEAEVDFAQNCLNLLAM